MKLIEFKYLELIASTVSRILATRPNAPPIGYVTSERQYDHDFNELKSDDGPYITPTYYGSTDEIPATVFERLFKLICTQSHAGLLLFHKSIQGINLVRIFQAVVNRIKGKK